MSVNRSVLARYVANGVDCDGEGSSEGGADTFRQGVLCEPDVGQTFQTRSFDHSTW
jgi:hypothetical protein